MGILEKARGRATQLAVKVVEKSSGVSLNKVSPEAAVKMLKMLEKIVGVPACRRQLIGGIESTFRDDLKTNPDMTVDDLVKGYMTDGKAYPELWEEIQKLGINEGHIRVLAEEAKGG